MAGGVGFVGEECQEGTDIFIHGGMRLLVSATGPGLRVGVGAGEEVDKEVGRRVPSPSSPTAVCMSVDGDRDGDRGRHVSRQPGARLLRSLPAHRPLLLQR